MGLKSMIDSARERMDLGRFATVKTKLRALCGRKGMMSEAEMNVLMDRRNALSMMKAGAGWRLVLERVANRKEQAFSSWLKGDKEGDLRVRVSELDDLLQWIEGEIAAGDEAQKQHESLCDREVQ